MEIDKILKEKYKVSPYFGELVSKLNKSIVKLKTVDDLIELDRFPLLSGNNLENPNKFSVSEVYVSRYWTSQIKYNPVPQNQYVDDYPSLETLEKLFSIEDDTEVTEEELDFPLGTFEKTSVEIPIQTEKGIPQGSATSPNLATMCLDSLMKAINSNSESKIIMYADDGLIFSESEKGIIEIKKKLSEIVLVNEEKSSFVKFNGSFCKSLKFCGLIYNPIEESLSSLTRKGASLVFGPVEQFLSYLKLNSSIIFYRSCSKNTNFSVKEFLVTNYNNFIFLSSFSKLKLFFNPSLVGYLINCLYLGSFSFEIKERNYFYEGKFSSWLNKRWTVVYRNFILCSASSILNLLEIEIEWILLNIISRKFNKSIFDFIRKSELVKNLELYLENCLPTVHTIIMTVYQKRFKSEEYQNDCENVVHKKLLLKLGHLHDLRVKIEKNMISAYEITIEDRKQLNIFVSGCFSLNKFNCFSFAIKDLRELYFNREILNKKCLINYTFSKSMKPRNLETLKLKESRKLFQERSHLYPTIVEQGLITKIPKNVKF